MNGAAKGNSATMEKPVRVTVTIPPPVLARLDTFSRKHGLARSAALSEQLDRVLPPLNARYDVLLRDGERVVVPAGERSVSGS